MRKSKVSWCTRWTSVRYALLTLSWASCASSAVHVCTTHPPTQCLPGDTDYGSGMVASVPDPLALAQLEAARAPLFAARQHGPADAEPVAMPSSSLHVSLLYGVTPQAAEPLRRSASDAFALAPPQAATLADIDHFDVASANKTYVVALVQESDGWASRLHQRLAEQAGTTDRFPYRPHVTLAVLPLGARLTPAQATALQAALAPIAYTSRCIYLTDRCGHTIASVRAHQNLSDNGHNG